MNDNFIPCAKWIRRGIAKSKPEVVKLSKEELKGLISKARSDILTTAESIKSCNDNAATGSGLTNGDHFGMEDYDKEDDVQSLIGIGNLISLDEEAENPDTESQEEDEDDDSDKEDDEIKPTDNLIAVGHVYGDISVLEVYVFNEEDNDLYVHHDIVLPIIPLALEWLSYAPGQTESGNLMAMGGMSPEITIWDLDVVNSLEPLLKLGEFSEKKKYQHRNHGHRDAVLDLSWNPKLPHVLASASVDRSVLLWDMSKARAVSHFNQFEDKVQSVEWHPSEVNVLIAGACDSMVRLFDCRIAEALNTVRVDGEVEKVVWHPTTSYSVLIGTSKGVLCCADCRSGKLLWEVKAHGQEVTGVTVHSGKLDSVVTCSTDQTVKVWKLTDSEPSLVNTKHTNLGELQCLQICPENPNIVCLGGNTRNNNFRVLNLLTDMQQDTNIQEMEISQQEIS